MMDNISDKHADDNRIIKKGDCVKKYNNDLEQQTITSRNVSFCRLIDDVTNNVEWKVVLIIGGICILLELLIYFTKNYDYECLNNYVVTIIPSILGFTITAYAILFSIGDFVSRRLKGIANDGKKPFEVLHATFVFGIFIQSITLIAGCIINVFPKECLFFATWFLWFFSVIWTLHLAFSLYALRTYLH